MAISSIPVLLLPLRRPAQVMFTTSCLLCCYVHHDMQDKLPCATVQQCVPVCQACFVLTRLAVGMLHMRCGCNCDGFADDFDHGYGSNYNHEYGRGYYGDSYGNFHHSGSSAAAAASSSGGGSAAAAAASSGKRHLLGDGYTYYGYHNYHDSSSASAAASASGGSASAAASAASSGNL